MATARKGRALARAWTKPGCPSVPVGLLPQRMAPAAPVRTGTRRMPWVCPERRASHAMAHARDSKGHGSCGGVSRRPMRAGRAPRRPSAPPLRACRAVPSLPPPPPACPPNCAAGRWSAPLAFLTRLTKASHAYQLYTFALQVHRPRARRPARPSRGSGADACGEGGTLGRSEAVATTGAARGGRRGGWGGAIEVCQWTDHCKSGGKDAARHTERR